MLALAAIGCCGASVPADVRVSVTESAISFAHDGTVLSTAVVCPGLAFDRFGASGPKLSPDNHWVLVDVLGPYTPGNVPRTHALVEVATGAIVLAPNFPAYLGIPASLEPLAWASGQRSTVAYPNGKSATLHDPPPHAIPAERCTPAPDGASARAPAPAPSVLPL